MIHFLGAGTIVTDIVRKDTRKGVLATFRLRSAPKGRGQVWVDVEAWGRLAGTIYRHGRLDRPVVVAGRLTHKTWHDHASGQARHRYVITATDIDLVDYGAKTEVPTTIVTAGRIDTHPTTRPAGTGTVTEFRLATGRAGTKTGRLWIDVEHWHREPLEVNHRDPIILSGGLAYGVSSAGTSRYYLAPTKNGISLGRCSRSSGDQASRSS